MTKRSNTDPDQISLLASSAPASSAVLEEPTAASVARLNSTASNGRSGLAGLAGLPGLAGLAGPLSDLVPESARESVSEAVSEAVSESGPARPAAQPRRSRANLPAASVRHGVAAISDDHGTNHQAELFYLQKQIQQQTQMIFILEDGSRIQGIVEWYDRGSIKVRGKSRVLIYKSAIKYLYKAGEVGSAPGA